MSSRASNATSPALPVGALMRFGLHEIRSRIYAGVMAAGFDDVRPSHVTLFRWPGPDGRRPTEVAADVQISKQRVNDLLRDLEQRGYLHLEPAPDDSRARVIRLSGRGRRLHRVAVEAHAAIERKWAQAIGQERYRLLCETLRAVVAVPGEKPIRPPVKRAIGRPLHRRRKPGTIVKKPRRQR